MERALVVLGETETGERLLREAGELAGGVDAELIVLTLLTEAEYEHDIDVLTAIDRSERTTESGGVSFEDESRTDLAREEGQRVAREVLEGVDVDYEVVGEVVDEDSAAAVIEAADRLECDHVFLVGARRSPVGKAVFGDVAQSVLLDFEGPVTVLTE